MELDERTKGLTVTLARTGQGGCRFARLHLRIRRRNLGNG
jgi:hypothetical protein